MKPTRSILAAGLLALFASIWQGAYAQPLPPQNARPTSGQQAQVFTLSNGMTLIVQPDRRAPTVAHMLWVRVGAMDEVDGVSGVAHVLEHMMFKGTPTVPEGEFSRRVAALGGRENAFTSRDYTAYFQQVPVNRLEDVMRLEADRFANNQWPDDAFQRELAVVKEERRLRVGESPQAQMFEVFNATAYQVHPYRRPIIGWVSDLDALTADDARAFFRQWYVPANAAVVVTGDVEVDAVKGLAEKYYGKVPARAVPLRKPHTEPAQVGLRRMEYQGRTAQPMLMLGYKAPSLKSVDAQDQASQDALALTLLAGVLDGHSAARLERSLVQGGLASKRLADTVGASFDLGGRGPDLFTLSATPAEGVAPQELEAALKAVVARVAKEGVSDAELQRVKNQWSASEVYKRDSMFAQARELGQYWAQGWPVDGADTLMQRLRAVTPEQVRSVAARWFNESQLTVGLLQPEVKP